MKNVFPMWKDQDAETAEAVARLVMLWRDRADAEARGAAAGLVERKGGFDLYDLAVPAALASVTPKLTALAWLVFRLGSRQGMDLQSISRLIYSSIEDAEANTPRGEWDNP